MAKKKKIFFYGHVYMSSSQRIRELDMFLDMFMLPRRKLGHVYVFMADFDSFMDMLEKWGRDGRVSKLWDRKS